MDAGALQDCSAEELDDAITRFTAGMCAVHEALLELIDTFETKGHYRREGAANMAAWLSQRFGLSSYRAHAEVRVARALPFLPLVRDAYAQGLLCFDSVEALCRSATPQTESELLEQALQVTSTELKALLAGMTPVEVAGSNRAYDQRYLRWFWDERSGMLDVKGKLADVEGAVVARALEHMTTSRREGGPPGEGGLEDAGSQSGSGGALVTDPRPRPSFEQSCADALAELASNYLDRQGDAVKATVVVHVDVEQLRTFGGSTGVASLDDGPMVCGETALRLACDCHCELVIEGPDRVPIGIGRRSRQIPGWLCRVLKHRDRTCRFPGCDRQRWTQHHHIRHWTGDGPTDTYNLVTLCWFHHRLVHEGGWRVKGDADVWLDFIDPTGQVLTSLPPPAVDPELKDSLFELFSGDPPEPDPP